MAVILMSCSLALITPQYPWPGMIIVLLGPFRFMDVASAAAQQEGTRIQFDRKLVLPETPRQTNLNGQNTGFKNVKLLLLQKRPAGRTRHEHRPEAHAGGPFQLLFGALARFTEAGIFVMRGLGRRHLRFRIDLSFVLSGKNGCGPFAGLCPARLRR